MTTYTYGETNWTGILFTCIIIALGTGIILMILPLGVLSLAILIPIILSVIYMIAFIQGAISSK